MVLVEQLVLVVEILEVLEVLVLINIDDDGPGIADEHKEKVFRPFYRVDKSRSLKDSNVGFAGFGTLVSLILMVSGFFTFMLGIIAEYIGLIYEEVKQRPNFVVSKEVGFSTSSMEKAMEALFFLSHIMAGMLWSGLVYF